MAERKQATQIVQSRFTRSNRGTDSLGGLQTANVSAVTSALDEFTDRARKRIKEAAVQRQSDIGVDEANIRRRQVQEAGGDFIAEGLVEDVDNKFRTQARAARNSAHRAVYRAEVSRTYSDTLEAAKFDQKYRDDFDAYEEFAQQSMDTILDQVAEVDPGGELRTEVFSSMQPEFARNVSEHKRAILTNRRNEEDKIAQLAFQQTLDTHVNALQQDAMSPVDQDNAEQDLAAFLGNLSPLFTDLATNEKLQSIIHDTLQAARVEGEFLNVIAPQQGMNRSQEKEHMELAQMRIDALFKNQALEFRVNKDGSISAVETGKVFDSKDKAHAVARDLQSHLNGLEADRSAGRASLKREGNDVHRQALSGSDLGTGRVPGTNEEVIRNLQELYIDKAADTLDYMQFWDDRENSLMFQKIVRSLEGMDADTAESYLTAVQENVGRLRTLEADDRITLENMLEQHRSKIRRHRAGNPIDIVKDVNPRWQDPSTSALQADREFQKLLEQDLQAGPSQLSDPVVAESWKLNRTFDIARDRVLLTRQMAAEYYGDTITNKELGVLSTESAKAFSAQFKSLTDPRNKILFMAKYADLFSEFNPELQLAALDILIDGDPNLLDKPARATEADAARFAFLLASNPNLAVSSDLADPGNAVLVAQGAEMFSLFSRGSGLSVNDFTGDPPIIGLSLAQAAETVITDDRLVIKIDALMDVMPGMDRTKITEIVHAMYLGAIRRNREIGEFDAQVAVNQVRDFFDALPEPVSWANGRVAYAPAVISEIVASGDEAGVSIEAKINEVLTTSGFRSNQLVMPGSFNNATMPDDVMLMRLRPHYDKGRIMLKVDGTDAPAEFVMDREGRVFTIDVPEQFIPESPFFEKPQPVPANELVPQDLDARRAAALERARDLGVPD